MPWRSVALAKKKETGVPKKKEGEEETAESTRGRRYIVLSMASVPSKCSPHSGIYRAKILFPNMYSSIDGTCDGPQFLKMTEAPVSGWCPSVDTKVLLRVAGDVQARK
jgi:hypothetical protein